MTTIQNLNAPPLFVAFDTPVDDADTALLAPAVLAYLKVAKDDQLAIVSARQPSSREIVLYPAVVHLPVGKSDFAQLVRKVRTALTRRGLTMVDFRTLGTPDDVARSLLERQDIRALIRDTAFRNKQCCLLRLEMAHIKSFLQDKDGVTEENCPEMKFLMYQWRYCDEVLHLGEVPVDVIIVAYADLQRVFYDTYRHIAAKKRELPVSPEPVPTDADDEPQRSRFHTPPTSPASLWLRLRNWFKNRE